MAGEYNIRRRETIRGNVDPYILEYKGIAPAVLQAANALEERRTKGAEIKSALTAAVNQLPLDHSEDTYKKEFIDRYSDLIKQDPFDVAKIQEYATQAANDPELLAKHRTHLEHEAFLKDVEDYRKAGKISSITAERLTKDPTNQYKFTPTYKDGVITGSEKWTPGKMPVQSIDRTAILAEARKFIAPLKTHTDIQRASSVTNPDGTGKGGSTLKVTDHEQVTEEMINQVFEGVFNAMPGAYDSLMQDRDDDIYRVNKYEEAYKNAKTPEERAKLDADIAPIKDRLYENGVIRSSKRYMAYSMGMIVPHMAYDYNFITDHTSSTIDNNAKGVGGGGIGGSGAAGAALLGSILGGMNWGTGTEMAANVAMNPSVYLDEMKNFFNTLQRTMVSVEYSKAKSGVAGFLKHVNKYQR